MPAMVKTHPIIAHNPVRKCLSDFSLGENLTMTGWTKLIGKEHPRHSAFAWHNTDNFWMSCHWKLVWLYVWLYISSWYDLDVILKHHGTSIGYTINIIKRVVGLQLTFMIDKLLTKWQVVNVMRDIEVRGCKWVHIMAVDMVDYETLKVK